MSLSELEQYVLNYNKSHYRLMGNGRCPPSGRQWEAFETAIDFKFPEQFKEFSLSAVGGLYLEVYEELWDRPKNVEPGLEWKNLYSIKVFGIGFGVPTWLDLREEVNALPKEETDLVPFMARGSECERYCFDLDEQIVRWSPEDGERTLVEENFYSLLMKEISDLAERYDLYEKVGRPKKKRKPRKKKKA